MNIFRKKLISVLLAISMVGAFSAVTVYADELDSTVTDNDYTTDDGNTGEIPPVEPPVVDDSTGDNVTDDTTDDFTPDDSYQDSDDSGNSSSSDTDIEDDNSQDYTDNNDYYGTTDDSYTYDDTYYSDYSYNDYNYGMSFDDFERATDYSATVDTETPTVDMYNSNGSDTDTLSSADWNDIRLNFGKAPASGVGDFSFIKDNTSDENSNFSILFLIFGIILVATSLILMIYLITTSIRSRKLAKAAAYSRGKNSNKRSNVKNTSSGENKRTKFTYDTSEIDISSYDDNF